MANEEPGRSRQQEEELTNLNRETEVTEARGKLADARRKLAEAEGSFAKLRQPWWRNGLTVTTITAVIAAIVPVTAQIQSWKEQGMKERELNFAIRDKYLTAVIRDPRQEQRVLEFIKATADDKKITTWAEAELEAVKRKVTTLDATAADRKRWYRQTMAVVSQLADGGISEAEWEKQSATFWHLYKTDLVPVESLEVESLMVRIGGELGKCPPRRCQAIQDLSYQLARQMKAEISSDASAATAPEAAVKPPDDAPAHDKP